MGGYGTLGSERTPCQPGSIVKSRETTGRVWRVRSYGGARAGGVLQELPTFAKGARCAQPSRSAHFVRRFGWQARWLRWAAFACRSGTRWPASRSQRAKRAVWRRLVERGDSVLTGVSETGRFSKFLRKTGPHNPRDPHESLIEPPDGPQYGAPMPPRRSARMSLSRHAWNSSAFRWRCCIPHPHLSRPHEAQYSVSTQAPRRPPHARPSGVLWSRRLESLVFLLNFLPQSMHWYTYVGPDRVAACRRATAPNEVDADRPVGGMNIGPLGVSSTAYFGTKPSDVARAPCMRSRRYVRASPVETLIACRMTLSSLVRRNE